MNEAIVRPDFPHVIDNTMRADFIGCPQRMPKGFLENWAPAAPSIHLHAGGAFARGLEIARRSFYEEGIDEAHSLKNGLEALMKFYGPVVAPVTRSGDKSLENVIKAFDSYFQRYRLGLDPIKPFMVNGKAMVEFTFAIPTELKHPQSGDPILYGGRSDMIGIMNDALWVTDEKTASQLGETWAAQWDLDSQFTGYIAAAHLHGYQVAGALVRGVGLLKTKITHSEALVNRSSWFIERWWQQLHRDIKRMISCWQEGVWDFALSKNTCAAYGGCAFKMLCESPQPESYLPIYFRQRKWNPLAKDSGENLLENPELLKSLEAPELNIPELGRIE